MKVPLDFWKPPMPWSSYPAALPSTRSWRFAADAGSARCRRAGDV